MGCDIHTIVEIKTPDGWTTLHLDPPIFDWRSYGLYGFLANVRNYSKVPNPWPPRGWPADVSEYAKERLIRWNPDAHSVTYVTLKELLEYDYSQIFEDRRTIKRTGNLVDCAALSGEGEGNYTTIRDFLGTYYFEELCRLSSIANDTRIVGCEDHTILQEYVRVLMFFDC